MKPPLSEYQCEKSSYTLEEEFSDFFFHHDETRRRPALRRNKETTHSLFLSSHRLSPTILRVPCFSFPSLPRRASSPPFNIHTAAAEYGVLRCPRPRRFLTEPGFEKWTTLLIKYEKQFSTHSAPSTSRQPRVYVTSAML